MALQDQFPLMIGASLSRAAGLPIITALASLALFVACTRTEEITEDAEIARHLGVCFELQKPAVAFAFRDVDPMSPRRTHLLFDLEGLEDLGNIIAELDGGTRFEIEKAYLTRGFENVYVELMGRILMGPDLELVNLSDLLNPDWSLELVSVLVLGEDREAAVFPSPFEPHLALPCAENPAAALLSVPLPTHDLGYQGFVSSPWLRLNR